MILYIYWDETLEQFWLSDGSFLHTELFGEIFHFEMNDNFNDLVYLGEL